MNQIASDKFRWMAFFSSIFLAVMHLTPIFVNKDLAFIGYYQQLAVPAMVYFMVSSAYFRFRKYKDEDYLPKMKKRVKTLLVPYVAWNTIGYVICAYYEYISGASLFGYIKMLIFVYIPFIGRAHEPMVGALWYVARLMTYELAAPAFVWLIRRKKIFWTTIVASFILIIAFNVNYYSFLYWMPFYLLGAYLAYYHSEQVEELLADTNRTIAKKILMSTVTVALFLGSVWIFWKLEVSYTIQRILFLLIIAACMYMFSCFAKPNWVVIHSPFFLFCSHIPLRWVLTEPLIVGFEAKLGYAVFAHFYFVSIMLIAYLLQWILYKIFPIGYKILTGER